MGEKLGWAARGAGNIGGSPHEARTRDNAEEKKRARRAQRSFPLGHKKYDIRRRAAVLDIGDYSAGDCLAAMVWEGKLLLR